MIKDNDCVLVYELCQFLKLALVVKFSRRRGDAKGAVELYGVKKRLLISQKNGLRPQSQTVLKYLNKISISLVLFLVFS